MVVALVEDVLRAARTLRMRPGFALAVISTIALAIGCNTAVFGVLHGLLLKPLPYAHGDRLVYVYNATPAEPEARVTVADYLDRRTHADALEDSALYYDSGFDLTTDAAPLRVAGVVATPSLFTLLGADARLGRTFTEDEAAPVGDASVMWVAGARVVVLSDALWRDRFGADPGIVGRDVRLNGQAHRVVGVMAAAFAYPRRDVQLWLPFAFSDKQKSDAMRGFGFAESIARLKPGATIAQLHAQLDAIAARNAARLAAPMSSATAPEAAALARRRTSGVTARARPLREHLAGDVAPALWLLQAGVGLLLAIACANVANLLLIRHSARRRELAVRAALGATRGRVARELLGESLLLALLGGAAGVVLAAAGLAAIRALGLDGGAHGFRVGLDVPVLGFALAATLATGAAFGALPVLGLRRDAPWDALHGARGPPGTRAERRTRDVLVVVQLGLAVALLAGAGLLLKSFANVLREDPGFATERLVGASVNAARDRYPDVDAVRRFNERLPDAVRALPGVEAVGVMSGMPFSTDFDSSDYFMDGGSRDDGGAEPAAHAYMQLVDETLFATLDIPLLRGRAFRPSDDERAPPVAIVDAEIARRHFGDRDPIGRRIATPVVDGLAWREIVGVVGSVKRNALSEPAGATFYWPIRQSPMRNVRLAIRTRMDAAALAAPLRAAVAALDPEQPVHDIVSMDERIGRSLAERRAALALTLAFAGVALVLGAIGVYGVLAFAVAQRTGEIGVRMSLGATRGAILRHVLADATRLLAAGLALGIALALAVGRQLEAQLFGVGATDPATLALVAATVAVVALAASWLPARRAAATSPMTALRCE